MALALTISSENAHDLRHLMSLGVDEWEAITDRLANADQVPIRRSELKTLVADIVNESALEPVVRQMIGLCKLARDQQTTSTYVLYSVRKALERDDWSVEELESWDELRVHLATCLEANALQAVVKALELAVEHERLLSTANIICDIRPIFDDARTEIIGGIIANLLRLKYYEERREKSMTLLLSDKDIIKLKDACDNALQKSSVSATLMTETCNVRTYSVEEEGDDET